ncbi:fimbrial protein [Escherichia coli]|uniref:F4 family fimbrial subunit n=1 Tax=Escherichia coli TaxID=562 RepID=UPI000BE597C1|nr:fimbrial protein [Escherichia coli]
MKKTLIALAVAASAAVSGSAMAWTANGTGSSVDLGGTLTPVDVITPWEVKTGDAVTGLNAQIQKNQKEVNVSVTKAIPILGIRTIDTTAFQGRSGISPQISYEGAVDLAGFNAGVTTVSMEVRDTEGKVIGGLVAPFTAAALSSYVNTSDGVSNKKSLYAAESGKGFFGGLGYNAAAVANYPIAATSFFSEASQHFDEQGIADLSESGDTSFGSGAATYSAFYASGIAQGGTIKITLDKPAGANEIVWNASLPVTVSYQ